MVGTNSFRGQRKSNRDGIQTAPIKDHLQKTFDVRHRSEMDGQVYEGQFTVKKMSIKDFGFLGTRRSQLNGGMYFDEDNPGVGIDESTHMTNNMIAHLEIVILQAPSWWDLDEIYDTGLIGEVFKHVINFESSFFRPNKPENAASDTRSSQEDSDGAGERTRPAGSVKKVGGESIPTSLDP